jgi:hypothetical protein
VLAEYFEPILIVAGLVAGWSFRSWLPVPLVATLWGLIVGNLEGSIAIEAIKGDVLFGLINMAIGVGVTKAWRAMFWEPRRPPFPRVSRSVS